MNDLQRDEFVVVSLNSTGEVEAGISGRNRHNGRLDDVPVLQFEIDNEITNMQSQPVNQVEFGYFNIER